MRSLWGRQTAFVGIGFAVPLDSFEFGGPNQIFNAECAHAKKFQNKQDSNLEEHAKTWVVSEMKLEQAYAFVALVAVRHFNTTLNKAKAK